ncbi:hypothetical protein L6452_37984 [Arctium lappa]|uniref:Uncharacterized protein n=1 Tax=Arctium lappa TaxID=4217 RepID=A0ACB8Y4Z4_ARCLA|nr:hypothetical protein L6452_37984 [Arctium lappa]
MEACTGLGAEVEEYKLTPNGSTYGIKEGDDPKACLALRYQDLSKSYTHIVTRASETERTYKVAREGFKRVWDDVNACLREERVEGGEKSNATGEINTIVKGIKINNKRMCNSSSRPKNALEKTRKKSKVSKNNLSTPEV